MVCTRKTRAKILLKKSIPKQKTSEIQEGECEEVIKFSLLLLEAIMWVSKAFERLVMVLPVFSCQTNYIA